MKHSARICCLLIIITGLLGTGDLPASDDSALIGKSAPDFSLKRYGGGSVSLSGLRGRVVLVAFWIPSVPECKEEIPRLEGLYNRLRARGLEIIGVDMKGNAKAATDFMERNNISYPLVQGNGRMALTDWGVKFVPSYFLIDRSGTVMRYYPPAETEKLQRIEEDILDLLGK